MEKKVSLLILRLSGIDLKCYRKTKQRSGYVWGNKERMKVKAKAGGEKSCKLKEAINGLTS